MLPNIYLKCFKYFNLLLYMLKIVQKYIFLHFGEGWVPTGTPGKPDRKWNFSKNVPSQFVNFTHLACSRPIFDSIFELYAPFYLLEKVFEHFFAIFLEIIAIFSWQRMTPAKACVFRYFRVFSNLKNVWFFAEKNSNNF